MTKSAPPPVPRFFMLILSFIRAKSETRIDSSRAEFRVDFGGDENLYSIAESKWTRLLFESFVESFLRHSRHPDV